MDRGGRKYDAVDDEDREVAVPVYIPSSSGSGAISSSSTFSSSSAQAGAAVAVTGRYSADLQSSREEWLLLRLGCIAIIVVAALPWSIRTVEL
jgi:hypothetical protein